MNYASQDLFDILYGRLSQEDDRIGESNSIHNQQLFLEKYARENGFDNPLFLADDGYSGTNFERPNWQKITSMIEAGKVRTLIVKDLSRLGREYLQVGYLTEIYFPSKGVRFIAVNDGVDSDIADSNDMSPIKNWANELHAKETSKKVRATKRQMAERGERAGGRPPYGYKKRSPDSKELVPDVETAPILQRIFQLCLEGKGPAKIARILTEEKILTPGHYYYRKYGKITPRMNMDEPYKWSDSTVAKILANKAYMGHTNSHTKTTVSYKNKTVIHIPEDQQILVEDTHEPLVNKDVWNIAKEENYHKHRTPKRSNEQSKYSGLVYCADCKKPMTFYHAKYQGKTQFYMKCSTYGRQGKDTCTRHNMRESELDAVVLDDLKLVMTYAVENEKAFADFIQKQDSRAIQKSINAVQREISDMNRRSAELINIFQDLYEDKVSNLLSAEDFKLLSARYNKERREIEEALPAKEEQLQKLRETTSNVQAFIEKAKKYVSIEELTPEILRVFIERIEIGERAGKYARNSLQEVRIIYRDIKFVDTALMTTKKTA